MEADLFVHGVPAGADTWKDEDRTYFRTFYDSKCPDKVKFLVQIRASGEKKYCYYNYLLYEKVVASDGRDGSYFGVSLRLDEYCREVVTVYYILETLYRKYVLGNFINAEAGRLRYAVNSFASVSAVLTNMEKDAGELILKSLDFNKSCVSLNAFPLNGSRYNSYNLYECAIDIIQQDMQRYGQVALSPYYQSHETQVALQQSETRIKEAEQQSQKQIQKVTQQSQQRMAEMQRECDKTIKRVKEDCDTEKEEISRKLTSAESEIKKHKQTIAEKESEIKNKETELARLKDENKRKEQYKSIEEIVESIQKPIKELAKSMQSIALEEPGGVTHYPPQDDEKSWFGKFRQGFVGFFHKYLNTILLVLILVLLVVHPLKSADDSGETEEQPTIQFKVQLIGGVAEGTWAVNGGETITDAGDPNMIYVTPTKDTVEITYCVSSINQNSEEE